MPVHTNANSTVDGGSPLTLCHNVDELVDRWDALSDGERRAALAQLVEAQVQRRFTALSGSEVNLRLIIDSIPALVGYFDPSMRYRFANLPYAEWWGLNRDTLLTMTAEQAAGPELFSRVGHHLERALAGESVVYEYEMTRPQGQRRFARTNLVPEFDAVSKVIGVFVLSEDITQRKTTQAALMQAQKMEAVGQLAGGLAHDFNNLLTVVIGNLGAIQERAQGPELNALVSPAIVAARRGASLIRHLLTFARQQPLEPQAVDVANLLQNAATLLRGSMPESIKIELQCGDSAECQLVASADPHQLENALLNLALNARDAMPAGGVLRLGAGLVALGDADARSCGIAPGAYVCLTVTDNGLGMSDETAARAVEPFFTTKDFGSGSGLGLSIVYGLAQQSSGGLRIRSGLGQGTEVSLFLPKCELAARLEHDENPNRPAQVAGQGLVLLVEDQEEVRRTIRIQLVALGYSVLEARDTREAMQLAQASADLVLVVSDIVMPGGHNGIDFARALRGVKPALRLLLISGYTQDDRDALPGCGFLAKPFSKTELHAALHALVET